MAQKKRERCSLCARFIKRGEVCRRPGTKACRKDFDRKVRSEEIDAFIDASARGVAFSSAHYSTSN